MERIRGLAVGDLTSPVPQVNTRNELETLSVSFRETTESLNGYIGEISQLLANLAQGDCTAVTQQDYRGDFAQLRDSLNRISENLNATFSSIKGSIGQIKDGLNQVSAVVQTNAATAEENSATSEEMSAQSAILRQEVEKFKLREGSIPSYRKAAAYSYTLAPSNDPPNTGFGADMKTTHSGGSWKNTLPDGIEVAKY